MKNNTLNICLGHVPFPKKFRHHIDLIISPWVLGYCKFEVVVPDVVYGVNGNSLSEYAQLLWLYQNLDLITSDFEYIRIFQYRRFVSPTEIIGEKAKKHVWTTAIEEEVIYQCISSFDRVSHVEMFNSIIRIDAGMMGHYANFHVLEDLLNFSRFLIDNNIMNTTEVVNFLRSEYLMPACNMGVFKKQTFREIFSVLNNASGFIHSPYFKYREGYQRRSMGFLLERLNSYLIMSRISNQISPANIGHNIIISDDITNITSTVSI